MRAHPRADSAGGAAYSVAVRSLSTMGALGAVALAACDAGAAYLPAGSEVPSAFDDPALVAQIDANDGAEREVLRLHGFADGAPAVYWELGEIESAATMPLHRLCRRSGARCVPVDHPYVVEQLPGDPGYSHFGRVSTVEVTGAWAGEVFPSRQAIDDGVRDGLLLAPQQTNLYVHAPIVHRDVRVEVGDDAFASPVPIYARGLEASCIDFAATHGDRLLDDSSTATILLRNVYILTRDGEDLPLNERMRGEDLTGDGDTNDSNGVLGVSFEDERYTPAWTVVLVTVPATYASIDTAMDQAVADARAGEDLFTIDEDYELTPIEGRVVGFEETGRIVDCPIQSAPGAL